MKPNGVSAIVLILVVLACESPRHYDENKTAWVDTVFTDNVFFLKNREWVYDIIYFESTTNDTFFESITMKCTGELYNNQIEYEYKYSEGNGKDRVRKSTTGAIDSKELLIIHPIRHNLYRAAEIAPFPIIWFPLVSGSSWDNSISPGQGWDSFDGLYVESQYEVIDSFKSNYYFEPMDEVWEIRGRSSCKLGESQLKLFYNDKYGFVEMRYSLYNDDKMYVKLTRTNY